MTHRSRMLPLAMAALLVTAAHSVAAQAQAPERALFLSRIGADTLAVEVMARGALEAEAMLRYRTPPLRVHQAVRVSPAQVVERIATVIRQGERDSVVQRAELLFAGDSARVRAEGAAERMMAVPPGAVPFMNLSGLTLELMLRRARALGGDSVSVPLLITGAPRPYVAIVRRVGADSVTVTIAGLTLRAATDATGRLLGAAVPAQGLVIERLAPDSRAAAWMPAGGPVSYAAPPGAPYSAQDVVVPARVGPLAGTLTRPAARGRVPAVLLVTGSGAQDRDQATPTLERWRPFREIADTLSRRGIAVLRLDDRGVGGSAAGDPESTMEQEAEDVRAALAWLRARPEVDPARIAVVGHSSGGTVAAMVASADGAARAVVMIAAPATTGRRVSEYQVRTIFAADTTLPPTSRDSLLGVALRQADSAFRAPGWLGHFAAYDPVPTARRLRVPTLILHGDTDRQVPVAHAAALARTIRAAGNRDVTLRTFARMNHLLVEDPTGHVMRYQALTDFSVRPDLRGALADWLARTLAAP